MDAKVAVRIEALGSLRNGVNFNQTQEGLGLPVVKVKDFGTRFSVPDTRLDELDPNRIVIANDLLLQNGDTLIIRSNGNGDLVGRCLFVRNVKQPTTFSGFCIRFRPDFTKIHPRYATYLLRSPLSRQQMVAFGSGTGIQNLNQQSIGCIETELPSLDQQEDIASLLGCLDDKIELNERANRDVELLASSLFRSWFVDFDPVAAKRDSKIPVGVPAEVMDLFPSHFEESELGPIPQGWRVTRVDQAFELNPRRELAGGEVAPYLEMAVLATAGHSPEGWVRRAAGSGMRFVNGDTLMARITPCLENGKTAFVDFLETGEVGWGSTEYVVIRSKPPMPLVGSYLLARSDDFRAFAIQGMTGSSGRQRVGADVLGSYKLALPSEPRLLNGFGTIIEPFFRMAHANSAESRALADLRDKLLGPILSGELTIKAAANAVGAAL